VISWLRKEDQQRVLVTPNATARIANGQLTVAARRIVERHRTPVNPI
jgi:hypothetical protein